MSSFTRNLTRNLLAAFTCWMLMSLAAPAAQAQCRIEPFGDSITAGILPLVGTSNGGYRGNLVYVPPTGMSLQMVGIRYDYSPPWMGAQAWHTGYPGWRTDQLRGVVPYDASYPNVILVHAGTNDILQGYGGYNAYVGLGYLVGDLSNKFPFAKILVAKIIPIQFPYGHPNFPYNAAYAYEVDSLNWYVDNIVAQLQAAGRRVSAVDLNTGFPTATLLDGIHPTDDGYAWMANKWRQAISAVGCY